VLQRGRPAETYNVGGLNEWANLNVVGLICALLDSRVPRKDGKSYSSQIEFVADRPGHDRRYAVDCSKIQRELGWRPAESFETGLAKTVDWFIANRAWCADITAKRYSRERLGKTA
jgi:dTDP-glucose 4,6-dehydratase